MGKLFTASSDGNKVIANYNNECTYALSFSDEAEAQLFVSELAETQEDFITNGRDNAKRKKAMFLNPEDCTVSMNFDTKASAAKWVMKAKLSSAAEATHIFATINYKNS
ncbi:MAG: hypothetical protein V8S04_06820 [Clostridia bacterium]